MWFDKLKENCGVFGIYNHPHASQITYLGLYALQHRGQESGGIVVSDGKKVRGYKNMGLVADIFNPQILKELKGHHAIGHIRYSTTGASELKNAQPFLVDYAQGSIAIAHNGNLVNTVELRKKLEETGSIFQSTMDSEVIIHLIARSEKKTIEDRIIDALRQVRGSFSLLFLTKDKLIGIRDPFGFRPLCLGKIEGGYVLSSETCAFDLIQAHYLREIQPGEMVVIDKGGLRSIYPFPKKRHAFCIFELIYFARPDSYVFGKSVYLARKSLGRQLAKEKPVEADLVVPMPDSGNCASLGYAQESRIPFELGIVRNHYVGRTFIQPSQSSRDLGVKIKLNPVREILNNKRVVIVEDSIVRGTTSRIRIKNLREVGAKEVHMRVSCPPHRYPCVYGIDFPTKEELIASSHTEKEICQFMGLDSLGYLSLEGMLKALSSKADEYCLACFNGEYPI
ncbi:MAG: amidophosphoribosyltransferase [Deltaproteobacteria bacterium]|nr:MAG: amidophosphoribosyltransferase [Deltaproteobacteria bacterium]